MTPEPRFTVHYSIYEDGQHHAELTDDLFRDPKDTDPQAGVCGWAGGYPTREEAEKQAQHIWSRHFDMTKRYNWKGFRQE